MFGISVGKSFLVIREHVFEFKSHAIRRHRQQSKVNWFNGRAMIFLDGKMIEFPLDHMAGKITTIGMAFKILDMLNPVTEFKNMTVFTGEEVICPKIDGEEMR